MKRTIVASCVLFLMAACQVEPEPLRYGEDACHSCKMTLMDRKFGAELVTTKGKIYKFDDLNCMMQFYYSGEVGDRDYAHKLVVDFTNPGTLIPAADAFYLKSSEIKSPMASHVAAFSSKAKLEEVQDELSGIYMVWGELVTQFK